MRTVKKRKETVAADLPELRKTLPFIVPRVLLFPFPFPVSGVLAQLLGSLASGESRRTLAVAGGIGSCDSLLRHGGVARLSAAVMHCEIFLLAYVCTTERKGSGEGEDREKKTTSQRCDEVGRGSSCSLSLRLSQLTLTVSFRVLSLSWLCFGACIGGWTAGRYKRGMAGLVEG